MWRGTGFIQLFTDGDAPTQVLITCRTGDRGGSYINGAEQFYRAATALCQQLRYPAPVDVVFNVLPPLPSFSGIERAVFIPDPERGVFLDRTEAVSAADRELLSTAGADWTAGPGWTPPVAAPADIDVWRVVDIEAVPLPHNLFRGIDNYTGVDWATATATAIDAIRSGGTPPSGSGGVFTAAKSLIYDPISITGRGAAASMENGQHRTEAMRRQGAERVLILDTRPTTADPLDGEIGVRDDD